MRFALSFHIDRQRLINICLTCSENHSMIMRKKRIYPKQNCEEFIWFKERKNLEMEFDKITVLKENKTGIESLPSPFIHTHRKKGFESYME
jgi:hypothetical protein